MEQMYRTPAKGIVYGIGVGPGDPELITLKALRVVRSCPIVAVPGSVATESLSYQIVRSALPEVAGKELVGLPSPMERGRSKVMAAHAANAKTLERYLDDGRDVAYLALGDPSIYCTFGYLRRALEADGYKTSAVAGVPSFCAAAARLGTSLAEGSEQVSVVPADAIESIGSLGGTGTLVVMKAGGHMSEVKTSLSDDGLVAQAVERCGMEGERTYRSLEEIPDDAGYLTIVIGANALGAPGRSKTDHSRLKREGTA